MKILLVNPPRYKGHPMIREMRCAGLSTVSVFPPVELAYLAGVLRQSSEVEIFDANALDKNFNDVKAKIKSFQPRAIVFTASPTSFSQDVQMAGLAKAIDKNIKTILLDSHIAPVMPEKIKERFPAIDHLVGQEPLVSIPSLLGLAGEADIEKHPLPAYDLLPLKKYFSFTFSKKKPFATLVTSVGCPNRCNFCVVGGATVERGYGSSWRAKSPGKIVREIKYLLELGVKSLFFFDETFTVSRQRVQDLCRILIAEGLKIDWSCNGRVDTLDEETIKVMKQAGCWNIMFGIECGSEGLLEQAQKGATLSRAIEAVKCCKKNKISVSASFVIGFPHETWKTIMQTLEIAKRINPYRAQFVILTPYPGTKLYDEVKEKGLLEQDYSFSGYDSYCADDLPALKTEKLSSKDLLRAQKYIFRKFYLRPSCLIRIILGVRSFSQFFDILKSIKYLR